MVSLSIIGSGRIVEEHLKAAQKCNIKVRYIFSSRPNSLNAVRLSQKYKIVCYIKVETEYDNEPMTHEEAKKEISNLKFIQPENIYKIEKIEDT